MKWKACGAVALGLSLTACGASPSPSAGTTPVKEFCTMYTTGTRYTLEQYAQQRYTSPSPGVRALAEQVLKASARLTKGLSIHREVLLVTNATPMELQTQPVEQASEAVDQWVTQHC